MSSYSYQREVSKHIYDAQIQAPPEFVISVEPKTLSFNQKGEEIKKKFRVTLTFKPPNKDKPDYVFGKLIWTNGKNYVVGIPIALNYPH